LRSTSVHGYYVFEGLITEEAGMIDFLVVGSPGACVVIVRDEAGDVTADANGKLYLDGKRFEDDPLRQAGDLATDVNIRLEDIGVHCYDVICFTRAELYYLGNDPDKALKGVCPTWDLALPFAEAHMEHTSADVAEMADRVCEVYGRHPFVVPEEDDTQ